MLNYQYAKFKDLLFLTIVIQNQYSNLIIHWPYFSDDCSRWHTLNSQCHTKVFCHLQMHVIIDLLVIADFPSGCNDAYISDTIRQQLLLFIVRKWDRVI